MQNIFNITGTWGSVYCSLFILFWFSTLWFKSATPTYLVLDNEQIWATNKEHGVFPMAPFWEEHTHIDLRRERSKHIVHVWHWIMMKGGVHVLTKA